jgi:7 transmembrane helices usually fused to an inactive transglutaminase/Transglutaminase-like superfamily
MSRTTLCLLTAGSLAMLSLGFMATRYTVLGDEVKLPIGPNTWKVTMKVQGDFDGDARIQTATPLDFGRQHVMSETYDSPQLLNRPVDARHPERRQVLWSRRGGQKDGQFVIHAEYYLNLETPHAPAGITRPVSSFYEEPKLGAYLDPEKSSSAENERLSSLAAQLSEGRENQADVAQALYRYVAFQIRNEPSIDGPPVRAADCLKAEGGDCAAKSRLLVALLRTRGIPARIVTGLTLAKGPEQRPHYWVEGWINEHWTPMCPFYHPNFGKVPSTYVVFGFGDHPLVRGRHVKDLEYAFLVEHHPVDEAAALAAATPLHRFFTAISLFMLPPPEQRLIEFLLLLPLAALIICVYRNIIGLNSFGTFAAALVGLSFRELHSLPGFLVFVTIVLIGWLMRRVLDYYHLLQVPRVSLMLSLIVVVLILAIVGANMQGLPATLYISLFPIIILTGMVERFWTLETEDGTSSSFRTLLTTMLIATTIALLCGVPLVVGCLFRYPEMIGLIMACQLLIGRYTGYRLTELFRFRDFLRQPPPLSAETLGYTFDDSHAVLS